ncbi:hypothetical protein BASA81_005737 [Batrachochytrium salamandrivorans]|nr:hypothetical protein BASA81_005737 [Batrachochytrium salamandrivorans]
MANSDISVSSVDHRQEPYYHIYHILDIRPCSRLNHLPPLHSSSNSGSPDGACLQDRSPYYKTRCSIPHNGPRRPTTKHHPAPRAPKQANPLAYSAKLPTSPSRPASTNSPTSTTITADSSQSMLPTSATNVLLFAISSGTPGSGPSQRPASPHLNSASLSLDSMSSSIQPLDLDAEESPSVSHRALVAMNMDILEPPPTTVAERLLLVFGKLSTELFHFDNNHPVLIFGDWNTDPQRLQRIVHSWGHGLTVMQFSGSQITRLSTVHGRRHSSIDHFVCNAPARALLTFATCGQTDSSGRPLCHSHIHSEQRLKDNPLFLVLQPYPAITVSKQPIGIATSNYWDVLADATLHGKHSLPLQLIPTLTQSSATLLRDEWSRLKAAATQLERVDGRKQWVKHADNLDRAVSDGRTDLVFSAARAMSGNSSRSAAVTPLYNSDGIVQYDPTSILRVMQGHYGSLAADTTGHSLDLQYWHDRQPIQVSQ